MSRPAYSAQDQTAKERICDSFWQILSDPAKKLTVVELCRLSGINKNTFYYHFETIDSLTEYIIDGFLDRNLAELVIKAALADSGSEAYMNDSCYSEGFRKLCLIASSEQPSLINRLKTAIRNIWCSVMDLDYSALPTEKKDIIDFMLGGILSILDQCVKREGSSFELLAEIYSRPFFRKTIANLYSELTIGVR
jgi:AcrR family transcriptional regulator